MNEKLLAIVDANLLNIAVFIKRPYHKLQRNMANLVSKHEARSTETSLKTRLPLFQWKVFNCTEDEMLSLVSVLSTV